MSEEEGVEKGDPTELLAALPQPSRSKTAIYTSLKSDLLVATIVRLARRIEERFPASGLSGVAYEFAAIAHQAQTRAEQIAKPLIWVRVLIAVLALGLVGALLGSFLYIAPEFDYVSWIDYVQVLESSINDAILLGAAIFFLMQLESRYKRRLALQALHELRSLAHVVDMHQLTKDSGHFSPQRQATPTSPMMQMTPYELGRYLDYCSEMLSLIGKVAALYAQSFDDGVVLASVNEIESLTTGLSRKIWQKLMVLETAIPAAREMSTPKAAANAGSLDELRQQVADLQQAQGELQSEKRWLYSAPEWWRRLFGGRGPE